MDAADTAAFSGGRDTGAAARGSTRTGRGQSPPLGGSAGGGCERAEGPGRQSGDSSAACARDRRDSGV